MFASINHKGNTYKVQLDEPIDISIPLREGKENVNAWYVGPVKMEPVKMGDWVGDVNQGGSVNFRNIFFNPHGNGTHTECVGHISKENFTINKTLTKFFFIAELVTVLPEEQENGDHVITLQQIKNVLGQKKPEAIVIRTISNSIEKINRQYSHTNPPFIHHEVAEYFRSVDIKHLLIDVPSIDKEEDGGKLLAHHAFWNYPEKPRLDSTVTELIYVPNQVFDGSYLLNIQIASFENDASPSKPLLFRIQNS